MDLYATAGSSPPATRPRHYAVEVLKFRMVREPGAPTRPVLSSPAAVTDLAVQLLPDDGREHFGVFLLNSQNRLLAYHAVSVGTLNAALVSPREVFGAVLRSDLTVASVVLVHNHPSGDPEPSREDIRLTRQLADAGRLLDIRVHDHVVVAHGTGAFVSLAERGVIS